MLATPNNNSVSAVGRHIDVTLLQRPPTYVMSLTHSVPRAISNYTPKNKKQPDIKKENHIAFATPNNPSKETYLVL